MMQPAVKSAVLVLLSLLLVVGMIGLVNALVGSNNRLTTAFIGIQQQPSSRQHNFLTQNYNFNNDNNIHYYNARIPKQYLSSTSLLMAGFGSSSSSGKDSKKKEAILKPKQQWDRFVLTLKKMDRITVGVRIVNNDGAGNSDDDSNSWFDVGAIKSIDNAYTDYAVLRQRGLIADHARRLYPTKVSMKDKLEWGYKVTTSDDDTEGSWTVVNKDATFDNLPADIDKQIGFEGIPDPSTGYYCMYNEGRIVNMADVVVDQKQGSSKSKRQQ